MADVKLMAIDASNFDDFMDLIEPLQDNEGCDAYTAADPTAVETFLARHGALALSPIGTPWPLTGDQGERRFFLGPEGQPAHLAPAFPTDSARYPAFCQTLPHLIAADVKADGSLFLQMAALTDAEGAQLACFYRDTPQTPWSIVHMYARPEADYLADLLAHPPIDGFSLLRMDQWQDGSATLTRLFIYDAVPYALPIYHFDRTGAWVSGNIPEDRHIDKARPVAEWLADSTQKYGHHVRALDPQAVDFSTLLTDAPARFYIIKYDATGRTKVTGAYVPPAEAPTLLTQAAHQATTPPNQPLAPVTLIPIGEWNREAAQAVWQNKAPQALEDFARSWPKLTQTHPALDVVKNDQGGFSLSYRAEQPLPWAGVLAVVKPTPDSPVSATLLVNGPAGKVLSQTHGADLSVIPKTTPRGPAAPVYRP